MKYYTYIHATPSGDVFYVGKGTGHRVFSTSDRTLHWRKIVAENDGILMKIVQRFDTEIEAFEHEKSLIEMYKENGFELVNMTEGGKGVLGYCQSEELREHKRKLFTGYKHKQIECPKCGRTGGETSMKRWHFEKCTGNRPYKSRITVFGKRIFLGRYETKEIADNIAKEFYDFVLEEKDMLNRPAYSLQEI